VTIFEDRSHAFVTKSVEGTARSMGVEVGS
jgi:ribosomal protein L11